MENAIAVRGTGGPGSSPGKRKAGGAEGRSEGEEVQVVEEDAGAITLASIKEAFKSELNQNSERIQQGLKHEIKQEIQHAVGGVQKDVVVRIQTVETEVTKQLKTTLLMLESLTDKQLRHSEELNAIKTGQAELEEKFSMETKALGDRLEAMEVKRKWGGGGGSAQSTSTGDYDSAGAPKQPALILGGWEGETWTRCSCPECPEGLRLSPWRGPGARKQWRATGAESRTLLPKYAKPKFSWGPSRTRKEGAGATSSWR